MISWVLTFDVGSLEGGIVLGLIGANVGLLVGDTEGSSVITLAAVAPTLVMGSTPKATSVTGANVGKPESIVGVG